MSANDPIADSPDLILHCAMQRIFLSLLAFAFCGGEAAAALRFPPMFIGNWGEEGRQCGKAPTGRVVIGRATIGYDGSNLRLLRVTTLDENVVAVKFRERGQIRVEKLTVGTTGSRLFRERYGKLRQVYYRCQ
jgi:hypothetical protein